MIELTIRGEIPALKNAREMRTGKKGNVFSTPSTAVKKRIEEIKQSYVRQLPANFHVIQFPRQVLILADIGVVYDSDLPKSDLDNSWTTLQEATFTAHTLAGPILQDDRQVASFWPIRRRIIRKDLCYSKLYVFEYEESKIRKIFADTLLTLCEIDDNMKITDFILTGDG